MFVFRLLRIESAHSNRGFLLNSYKSQLADLSKEKEKLAAQIKELENENNSLRNSNAQLKSSVTLMNREKEKLAAESEKSETEIVERVSVKTFYYIFKRFSVYNLFWLIDIKHSTKSCRVISTK